MIVTKKNREKKCKQINNNYLFHFCKDSNAPQAIAYEPRILDCVPKEKVNSDVIKSLPMVNHLPSNTKKNKKNKKIKIK